MQVYHFKNLFFLTLMTSIFAFSTCQVFQSRDATLIVGATGEDVVDATIAKINTHLTSKSDYSLLKRIAYVESSYGEDKAVINNNVKGGIWQVSPSVHNTLMLFKEGRQDTSPANLINKLRLIFDMPCFPCNDSYNTPMLSGLAARVYLEISVSDNIPKSVSDQSLWWSKHYHPGADEKVFVEAANGEVDNKTCDENLMMDLWFLLDGSGSVSGSDFGTALNFTSSLASRFIFNQSKVRFGFSVFSFSSVTYFKFNDDPASFASAIVTAKQPKSRTEIGLALTQVLDEGYSTSEGARTSHEILKVLVIITDGKSTDDITQPIGRVHAANITVFAVAIGDQVDDDEIKLMATDPVSSHAYFLSNYDELITSLYSEIYKKFCQTPIRLSPELEDAFISLRAGDQKQVAMKIPAGKNLYINFSTNVEGSGRSVFISAVVTEPNSAFYDILLVLKKGWNEVLIKASELLEKHPYLSGLLENSEENAGVLPIYMTIRTTEDSDLTLGTQVQDSAGSQIGKYNSTMDGDLQKPINLNALWISLSAIALVIFVAVSVNFYRNSFTYKAKKYRRESRRNTEETLQVLEVLHAITIRARRPTATLSCMIKLQEQLEYARTLDVPAERLKESYRALSNLEHTLNVLRKDLKKAAKEAAKPTAGALQLQTIEELLEYAKSFRLPPKELFSSNEACLALKLKLDKFRKELAECKAKTKRPAATIYTLDDIEEKIKEAEKLDLPEEQLEDSRKAIDDLKDRILQIKKDLRTATDEASYPSADGCTFERLQDMVDQGEELRIPPDYLKKSLEALDKLKQRFQSIGAELKFAADNGKKPTATVDDMLDLMKKIKIAEIVHHPNEEMVIPNEVLDKLKAQNKELENAKSSLKDALLSKDANIIDNALSIIAPKEASLQAWNPADKELLELLTQARETKETLKEEPVEVHNGEYLLKKLQSALDNDVEREELGKAIQDYENYLMSTDDALENEVITRAKQRYNRETITSALKEVDQALISDITKEEIDDESDLSEAIDFEKQMMKENEHKESQRKAENVVLRNSLREKLQLGIDSNTDTNELKAAMREFEAVCEDDTNLSDKALLSHAKAKVFSQIKRDLLDVLKPAIESNDVNALKSALDAVGTALEKDISQKEVDDDSQLQDIIQKARELLHKLTELERMKEAVLQLNQATISEIRSYTQPPTPVRKVMEATLLLLGHSRDEIKEWTQVQALVGKMGQDSLKRRIADHDCSDVKTDLAVKAAALLSNLNMDEVEETSKASAVFFAWTKCILQEYNDKASSS